MLTSSFRKIGCMNVYTGDHNRLSIPNLNHIMAIDSVLGILREILSNYDKDYLENQEILSEFPPKNEAEFQSFSKREVWRMSSFILFALNLKVILEKEYEVLYDLAAKLMVSGLDLKEDLLRARNGEVAKYVRYRNKIFAHTAFGSPRAEDDIAMRETSLSYFSGGLVSVSKVGIGFGGAHISSGNGVGPGFEPIDHTIIALEFDEHFKAWHLMFLELINKLKTVPNDNIITEFGAGSFIVKE